VTDAPETPRKRGKARVDRRGPKPILLDDNTRKRLLDALRGGNYQDTAVAYAGVGRSAYYTWLARGRKVRDGIEDDGLAPAEDSEDQMYLDFLGDVEKARADAKVRALALVQKAAFDDGAWQAAAWFLERTAPQEFGRQTRLEHTGKDGGPVELQANVSVDDLALALDEIIDGKK
jgi:hypothetical protein